MRKGIIATLCAFVIVATVPALAGVTELPLTLPEKAGWCALETSLALAGDIIEHQGCEDTKGLYDITLDIDSTGNGTGAVDNVDLVIALTDDSTKGEKFKVDGDGDFDNIALDLGEMTGKCQNNTDGDIIIGDGKILINGTKYDWTFIKDLYERDIRWGAPAPLTTIIDEGLEVITKLGYPRAKYRQNSKYRRPDGGDGKIWVKKLRIAPNGAPDCTILLLNLEADNSGEGLQVWGKMRVK
jgi:hypothetical protein